MKLEKVELEKETICPDCGEKINYVYLEWNRNGAEYCCPVCDRQLDA